MRDVFDPSYDVGPLILSKNKLEIAHNQRLNREEHPAFSAMAMAATAMPSIQTTPTPMTMSVRRITGIAAMSATQEIAGVKRHTSQLYEEDGHAERGNTLLDCESLQSSLKRVKLSCSPGELRLQRDLKLLSPKEWQAEEKQHRPKNCNDPPTSWVHLRSRARLKLVDSLRLYLFLPADNKMVSDTQSSGQPSSAHHPHHYCWRMMIQIPRMFPHRPPVVSRLEGKLWVNQIVINEAPPAQPKLSESLSQPWLTQEMPHHQQDCDSFGHNDVSSSSVTLPEVEPYHVCGGGKTVVWNKWSPISNLGELLDFLLTIAFAEQPFGDILVSDTSRPVSFQSSSRVVSDEGCWTWASTSSSSSSFSSFSGALQDRSMAQIRNDCSLRCIKGPYYEEEHKFEDASMTSNGTGRSPLASRFLTPNRFDVGYGKYNNEDKMLVFPSAEPQLRLDAGSDDNNISMMETN
ncbi:hypothetical protein IV203_031081 [Nitzschia inconspicua]|uniref:Uncharacterized protein n=1 Tax=Nitzschia inconspicua TaxID=303405 RepID=A0A9K3Q2B2_9STRA|nr:hypothetical protein IV203_031081 [Nitzschia inconspicua]